jgi:hypothetical protein
MNRKISKTPARVSQSEKTVSVEIGPPRKSSADWLYSLSPEAVRKGGRLRFVTRRRFVRKASSVNGNGNGAAGGTQGP